jgi:hypothetical protein
MIVMLLVTVIVVTVMGATLENICYKIEQSKQ